MDITNHDAYSEKQKQELDRLEQVARKAGRTAKESLLVEERALSEDGIVTFATALARMYIQKHLEHLDTEDITLYMLHYLRFFRVSYIETERRVGDVSYHPSIWK